MDGSLGLYDTPDLYDLDQCHIPEINQNREELKELLSTWNVQCLLDHFVFENIFVPVLKIVKRHHLEKLVKSFDLGTQILFEHELEKWRESIGYALAETSEQNVLRDMSSSSNTAQNFEEKGTHMTFATSYRLEREILERFPTEKLEYYRSGKRGKIYNRYFNTKTAFKSIVQKHVQEEIPKLSDHRCEKNVEPEENAEACLKSLKFELLVEHFDNTRKACTQYRLQDLKQLGSTHLIFEK